MRPCLSAPTIDCSSVQRPAATVAVLRPDARNDAVAEHLDEPHGTPATNPHPTLLVSRSALLAAGLDCILRRRSRASRLTRCGTGAAAMRVRGSGYDLVVIDSEVLQSGSVRVDDLRELLPAAHLMVLYREMHADKAIHWIQSGADSLVPHDADDRRLADALQAIESGEPWIDPALQPSLVERLVQPVREPPRLTARELDVLQMVARGMSNKLIGHQLQLAEGTVKTYLRRLRRRLGARDRTQAVVEAIRLGLVSP
jgi:DNA-binding NarL/FixJ family response regulator